MTDIHTTAKGVTIYVDTNYDISSATTLEIHFSAPSGGNSFVNSVSTSALGANFTTSYGAVFSADNTLVYKVNSGDFSMSGEGGTWKCWVQAEFGSEARLVSNSFRFRVDKPGK
jgi:hypothetical protein